MNGGNGLGVADCFGLRHAPHLPAARVPVHLAALEVVIPRAEVGGFQRQAPLFGSAANVGRGLLGLLAGPDGVIHQVDGGTTGRVEGFIGLLKLGVDPLGLLPSFEGVFSQAQGGPAGGLDFSAGGLEFDEPLP